MKRPTHIAFLLPFGELKDAFFPDTLLSELAANVEDQGHRASVIRVYYDGHSATADAEVSRRLLEHLNAIEADVVVLDRLFEPQPLVDWQSAASSRRVVVVARGDTLVPLEGVNLIIGAVPGTMRKGATRRVPTPPDLALALRRLISALEAGADPAEIPGVGVVESDSIRGDASIERATREGAYRAVTQETVIALGDPPPVLHRALHGNAGCPYGRNPLEQPHYARVTLPESLPIARLGCAFCGFGGDYEKRQNTDVVGDLVEQAAFWSSHTPGLESFVLSDQYAIPYLEQLLVAAQQAGVPPVRWLFPCRADTLVAQRDKLESAIRTAQASEYVLEVFLTGFEAFSDTELARYNKGHDSSQSIAAIQLMRELGARYPGGFAYAQAKAHSLILFNPWTTPEDVLESARALRRHGLGELFRDVAHNRLRLYPDLPIYYAAQRDGALCDEWQDADGGSGKRKGYSVEAPWRFLDPRTAGLLNLTRKFREAFGVASEISQLHAAVGAWLDEEAPDVEESVAAARRLAERMQQHPHRRAAYVRAAAIHFTGACNNACLACANQDRWLPDSAERLQRDIAQAKHHRAVAFSGREPTLHPAFLELLGQASQGAAETLGLISNGRRFAYQRFALAARRAGLSSASVKLFGASAESYGKVSREPEGFEQALAGLANLIRVGCAVELRLPLYAAILTELTSMAELAARLGVGAVRIEASLDGIGVSHYAHAIAAIDALEAKCSELGLSLAYDPFPGGQASHTEVLAADSRAATPSRVSPS